jgi:hypothetical protein
MICKASKRLSSPFLATQSMLLDDDAVTAQAKDAAKCFGFSIDLPLCFL